MNSVKSFVLSVFVLISFQNTLYAPLTPAEQLIQDLEKKLEKKREESRLQEIIEIQGLHGKFLEEIRNRIKYEIKKIGSLAEVQQKIQNRLRQSIPEKKQSRLICDLKETEFIQQQSLINLKDYQEELQQKEQQFQIAEQTLEQKDLEELEQLQQEVYNNFVNFMKNNIKKNKVNYIKNHNSIESSEEELSEEEEDDDRVYYTEQPSIVKTVQNLFTVIRYLGSAYLKKNNGERQENYYENQADLNNFDINNSFDEPSKVIIPVIPFVSINTINKNNTSTIQIFDQSNRALFRKLFSFPKQKKMNNETMEILRKNYRNMLISLNSYLCSQFIRQNMLKQKNELKTIHNNEINYFKADTDIISYNENIDNIGTVNNNEIIKHSSWNVPSFNLLLTQRKVIKAEQQNELSGYSDIKIENFQPTTVEKSSYENQYDFKADTDISYNENIDNIGAVNNSEIIKHSSWNVPSSNLLLIQQNVTKMEQQNELSKYSDIKIINFQPSVVEKNNYESQLTISEPKIDYSAQPYEYEPQSHEYDSFENLPTTPIQKNPLIPYLSSSHQNTSKIAQEYAAYTKLLTEQNMSIKNMPIKKEKNKSKTDYCRKINKNNINAMLECIGKPEQPNMLREENKPSALPGLMANNSQEDANDSLTGYSGLLGKPKNKPNWNPKTYIPTQYPSALPLKQEKNTQIITFKGDLKNQYIYTKK